jgi:putative chitinase
MAISHKVVAGETLSLIAKRYLGEAARYTEIAELNQLTDPNRIQVGQILKIPDSDSKQEATTTELIGSQNVQTATTQTKASNDTPQALVSLMQLQHIFVQADAANISTFVDAINQCLQQYQINTPLRIAHFLAQIAHESDCLRFTEENLNYSAKALRSVFGKYFTDDALAEQYARKPQAIANRVYASRMGNGDEASNDGWTFRGRGLIQLTGRNNYRAFSEDVQIDIEEHPERCSTDPEWAVKVAGWYWNKHQLNELADKDDVRAITKAINGGFNGFKERKAYLQRAKVSLNIQKAA